MSDVHNLDMSQWPTAKCRLVGGFGNRLFILAFLYAYGKRNSCRIKFDIDYNVHSTDTYKYILDKFYAMENYNHNAVNCVHTYIESSPFTYSEFSKINHDTFFGSYFQNEKYFKEYRDDILRLYAPTFDCQPTNSMFIHVRLGDYMTASHHFIDLALYFKRCLEQTSGPYHLFCDTPEHLQRYYPLLLNRSDITLIEEKDELKSFYMMVNCTRGGICSNSSFSWFASWLNDNPNKQVFLPDRWFNGQKTLLAYEGSTVVSVDAYI